MLCDNKIILSLKAFIFPKLGAGGGLMRETISCWVGNGRFNEAQRQLGCYSGQLKFNLKKNPVRGTKPHSVYAQKCVDLNQILTLV